MQLMTTLITLIFVLLPAHQTHSEPACYPEAQAQAYIKDLQIAADTFEGGLDLCRSNSQLVQFFQTLDFIRTTKLPDDRRPPFVPGLISPDYYAYLKANLRFVNGPLRGCPMGIPAVACAGGMGELVIGDLFFNQRKVLRASAIIHEVRHLEGSFPHVRCTQGNENGAAKGCDESFESGSTYAVQIEYLSRLFFFAKDLSDDDRIAAKGMALYLAQNKFNTPTLNRRDAAVLIDSADGSVVLFDGAKAQALPVKIAQDDIAARDRNFVVIPHSKTAGNSYLLDPYLGALLRSEAVVSDPDAIGQAFVDFNTKWSAEKRGALLDAIRFGSRGEQAMLFSDRIEIIGPQSSKSLAIGDAKIVRLLRAVPCLQGQASGDPQDIMALSSDGHVWRVHTGGSADSILEPAGSNCSWPEGLRDYAVLNSEPYGLTEDGKVVKMDPASGINRPVEALDGRRFRRLLPLKEPLFWDFMRD